MSWVKVCPCVDDHSSLVAMARLIVIDGLLAGYETEKNHWILNPVSQAAVVSLVAKHHVSTSAGNNRGRVAG